MDQTKIGIFIAERRKEVGLTQMQLAEKLNITDRAVSKWERGKAMPDSSIMLELCCILKITVNDLLSGGIVKMDNYNKELENKLIEVIKQKEQADKRLLKLEILIGILGTAIILIPAIIGKLIQTEKDWLRLVVAFSGFIPGLIVLMFAIRIEQVAGYYVCGACKHKYVPSFKAVCFAQHIGRTRKLKCPNCGKKTWQKKVINSDKQ